MTGLSPLPLWMPAGLHLHYPLDPNAGEMLAYDKADITNVGAAMNQCLRDKSQHRLTYCWLNEGQTSTTQAHH